ncbi:unnamed protein product [Trichobilharzia regenti]|nr:unnamed protein product [Trichobilharzia regenti]
MTVGKCCYNVTNLNSGAHYHYKVVASNAAGSASVQGQFWTRTVSGHEPVLRQTHLLGKANLFQQPTVIVPITALFAVLLLVTVALLFFCRHRRLEEDLTPNKDITVTHNDLLPSHQGDSSQQQQRQQQHHQQQQQQSAVGHSYHAYHVGRKAYGNDSLPPIPAGGGGGGGQQPDSQASTVVAVGRHRSGGIKSWFNGTRMRLYDRGHPVNTVEPPSLHTGANQIGSHIVGDEDERLSTNSIDSEGNERWSLSFFRL